jgi:hypothetical protein
MIRILPNSTKIELIAPCGINCRVCMAYGRTKNVCPGCRGEDTLKSKSCAMCRIKNCEKLAMGKFEYCYECDAFPCALLAHLDKRYRTRYGTNPIGNLRSIQIASIYSFIEAENKRWTCPQCGGMLCMHKPECLSCGYGWHIDHC